MKIKLDAKETYSSSFSLALRKRERGEGTWEREITVEGRKGPGEGIWEEKVRVKGGEGTWWGESL